MIFRKNNKQLIKESFDNLPTGIILANLNGVILLANRVMYQLYDQLSGEVLRSAHAFWHELSLEHQGLKLIERGVHPVLQFKDGRIYQFSKGSVQLEHKTVLQIEAVDITQLHQLRLAHLEKNRKLRQLRNKMVESQNNLERVTREEEVIDAKLKIHNTMGMGLTAIRRYLTTGRGDIDRALSSWSRSLELLVNSESFVKGDYFSSLQRAAHSIGIDLIIDGAWPRHHAVEKVIIAAGRECLINACLHGNAKRMHIAIVDLKTAYQVTFSNDGQLPDKEVKPGGGFMSIERSVSSVGGSFTFSELPQFTINLSLPKQ